MGHSRRSPGALKRQVLAALAGAQEALTPDEVREIVDPGLAYTTVMTVLTRLADEGVVTRQPSGRGYAYRLAQDENALTAARMRRLLDAGGDHVAVLSRFVDALSDEDERLLVALFEEPELGTSGPG